MVSPFNDAFIATLRRNIEGVFSAIRKLAARQSEAERASAARFETLEKRIAVLEKVLYNAGDVLAVETQDLDWALSPKNQSAEKREDG